MSETIKVKIKTWDEMLNQYGGNSHAINVPFSFTHVMEEFIPPDRIIEVVDRGLDLGRQEYRWQPDGRFFSISNAMIDETWSEEIDLSLISTKAVGTINPFNLTSNDIRDPEYHSDLNAWWVPINGIGYLRNTHQIASSMGVEYYFRTEQEALFTILRYKRIHNIK